MTQPRLLILLGLVLPLISSPLFAEESPEAVGEEAGLLLPATSDIESIGVSPFGPLSIEPRVTAGTMSSIRFILAGRGVGRAERLQLAWRGNLKYILDDRIERTGSEDSIAFYVTPAFDDTEWRVRARGAGGDSEWVTFYSGREGVMSRLQPGMSAPVAPPPRPSTLVREVAGLPRQGEYALPLDNLVQLVVLANAEAIYSRLQSRAAEQIARSESGQYEPVFYSNLLHEVVARERTASELSAARSDAGIDTIMDSMNRTGEIGLRSRIPSGGELKLSYKLQQGENEYVERELNAEYEYTSTLSIALKQPLWRGLGRIGEVEERIARLEHEITIEQYKQQLLRTVGDTVRAYWQHYRAHEVLKVRREALTKAQQLEADMRMRAERGRIAASEVLEASASVAGRSADVARAVQALSESESRIKSLLNLAGMDYVRLRFIPTDQPDSRSDNLENFERRYHLALPEWPGFRIAQIKRQQGIERRDYALDQGKMQVDLLAGYSQIGYDVKAYKTIKDALGEFQPNWYLGLNMELPLGGNIRSRGQVGTQQIRINQADLEIDNIRNNLANDLLARTEQLEEAHRELVQLKRSMDLRVELLSAEEAQFRAGKVRLADVIQREDDLIVARQNYLEGLARLELARASLDLADGTLLSKHSLQVTP
jgi:outer membrane protein TolC